MRVKRYVVDSMPDALQRIRSDLGKDAVILNTKEIRSGGILGLFSKKKIEVIAAIDSSHSAKDGNQSVQDKLNKPVIDIEKIQPTPNPTHSSAQLQAASVAVLDQKLAEAKSQEKEEVKFPKHQKQSSFEKDDDMAADIKQMKHLINSLIYQKSDHHIIPEAFVKVEKKLEEHEFDIHLIHELILASVDKVEGSLEKLTESEAFNLVKSQLKNKVKSLKIEGVSEETKIFHFVGPTGVGKTTTIAKLAAEQVLKKHKKIGFITSDTYRIAAVEQLRTYATILNVPLEVVYSPQDLKKAIDKFKDLDMIFMDTAGRNFRNELYVSELNSLLSAHENSETYLVLSMTMKYKDMKIITNNFSEFRLDKVLFTKRDETASLGSIFNIINDFSLQLSYITNGQNVPDDISEINIDEIIDQILEVSIDE